MLWTSALMVDILEGLKDETRQQFCSILTKNATLKRTSVTKTGIMHSYNSRRLNGRIYKCKIKIASSHMIAISELGLGS